MIYSYPYELKIQFFEVAPMSKLVAPLERTQQDDSENGMVCNILMKTFRVTKHQIYGDA